MGYSLLATKRFRKELGDLDTVTKNKVKKALEGLQEDPYTSRPNIDIKQLKNMFPKKFRLRVGDFRIFYHVDGKNVMLLKIADRKNAYKR